MGYWCQQRILNIFRHVVCQKTVILLLYFMVCYVQLEVHYWSFCPFCILSGSSSHSALFLFLRARDKSECLRKQFSCLMLKALKYKFLIKTCIRHFLANLTFFLLCSNSCTYSISFVSIYFFHHWYLVLTFLLNIDLYPVLFFCVHVCLIL